MWALLSMTTVMQVLHLQHIFFNFHPFKEHFSVLNTKQLQRHTGKPTSHLNACHYNQPVSLQSENRYFRKPSALTIAAEDTWTNLWEVWGWSVQPAWSSYMVTLHNLTLFVEDPGTSHGPTAAADRSLTSRSRNSSQTPTLWICTLVWSAPVRVKWAEKTTET